MFIGVAGLIGVGKSTFTTKLTEHFQKEAEASGSGAVWKARYEPVETNPYLEDFYKDIERWTFNMQMFLLAARFRQHQEVLWDPCHRTGGGIIQDRTIYEDTIFARMHNEDGLMTGRDWDTYIDHFYIMQGFLRYPDVIVYLRVSPDIALARIRERGREAEADMSIEYLERLYEGYEEFAEEMQRYTVVITLDWSDFQDIGKMAEHIVSTSDRRQKFLRSLRRI